MTLFNHSKTTDLPIILSFRRFIWETSPAPSKDFTHRRSTYARMGKRPIRPLSGPLTYEVDRLAHPRRIASLSAHSPPALPLVPFENIYKARHDWIIALANGSWAKVDGMNRWRVLFVSELSIACPSTSVLSAPVRDLVSTRPTL